MARGRLQPDQGETLSVFLKRAVAAWTPSEGRRPSVRQLAKELDGVGGKTASTWERQLRHWGQPDVSSLEVENAEAVGNALGADFASFTTHRMATRDVLSEVLRQVAELETRVAALEER